MEIIPVLHNIRSCYNVGAIMRTAEGLGVKEMWLSGYTPRLHDPRILPHLRAKLDHEIHKTALGAEEMLKLGNIDDLPEKLQDYRERGYQIVGLDNNIKKDICQLNSQKLKQKIGKKVILILGEEVEGIAPDLYDLIDFFVEIPMKGKKESFNVSVAAGIAMYGIMEL